MNNKYRVLIADKITDDGLKHIAAMTELEVLTLSEVKITDAGLEHLRNLKKLKAIASGESARE